MALTNGQYTSAANLILNPTNYATGGTDLGLIGSDHVVGFNKDVSLISKVTTGSQFLEARLLGINLIYEIILLNMAANTMNLLFDGESASSIFQAYSTYLPGQLVGTSQTRKLLVRPSTGLPHLYIPRALIINAGPVQWSARHMHLEATKLTIVALWDTTRGAAFHYGDAANLTAI